MPRQFLGVAGHRRAGDRPGRIGPLTISSGATWRSARSTLTFSSRTAVAS